MCVERESKFVRRSVGCYLSALPLVGDWVSLHSVLQQVARQPVRWEVRLKKELSDS